MLHRFNDTHADGSDNTLVRPSNWNDTHIHAVRSVAANTAGATTDDMVICTATLTYTLPAPSNTGAPIEIICGAAGIIVTVVPNGAEKINALNNLNGASYQLTNPGQVAKFVSDGTNWWVTRSN